MNSENSRTFEYHVLVLKFTGKLDLRRGRKSVALSNLSLLLYMEKHLKYLLQHGVMNLNYQMDHIEYQIFKIILSIFLRSIVKTLIIHQSQYM